MNLKRVWWTIAEMYAILRPQRRGILHGDYVFLIVAHWPEANASLIWRDRMFETKREAVENFRQYAGTFDEQFKPYLKQILKISI